MPSRLVGPLLAASLVLLIPIPAQAANPALERPPLADRWVPGEVVVRFKAGVDPAARRSARAAARVRLEQTLRLARTQVVDAESDVRSAVRRLERHPGVAYAQPNYRYEALAPPPDDTFFQQLWGLGETPGVGALTAWDTTRGAGPVLAVVDTGVDLTHVDLAPNLWSNPGEVPGNGLDDEGNGIVDDVRGADFVHGDGNPDDYQFHGTHVAGTAAAVDNNALGVAGVAPDAQIMAVRALDGDGAGSSAAIAQGIEYAAREGASVINLSLGGPAGPGDEVMSDAVEVARRLNAVVVVAAGNSGSNNDTAPVRPCNFTHANLICVAAVSEAGDLADFSNFGAVSVDVGAPGVEILSTKTDYGPPVFSDDFNGTLAAWDFFTGPGGVAWGPSATAFEGQSATDSPGVQYANNSDSEMFSAAAVDLNGQHGCRMHFDLSHNVEDPGPGGFFDVFLAGAVTNDPTVDQLMPFAGNSFGFFPAEVSISNLDGRTDVFPIFALLSDASDVDDGGYVDRLRVVCRDSSYVDLVTTLEGYEAADAGNYVQFDGTSMAAPHVAGVAALVRAADPGAPGEQVVQAIKQSVAPLASLQGVTSTGGVADADAAVAAALALPNSVSPPPPPPPPPVGPVRPNAAGLRDAKGRIRVSRRRAFSYPIRAATGLTGAATFRTRKKVVVSRRAHLTIARKRFRVPRGGRVTLRVKLSRKEMRVLRRNRRLPLRVTVVVRDAAGLTATARRKLTLLPPKARRR